MYLGTDGIEGYFQIFPSCDIGKKKFKTWKIPIRIEENVDKYTHTHFKKPSLQIPRFHHDPSHVFSSILYQSTVEGHFPPHFSPLLENGGEGKDSLTPSGLSTGSSSSKGVKRGHFRSNSFDPQSTSPRLSGETARKKFVSAGSNRSYRSASHLFWIKAAVLAGDRESLQIYSVAFSNRDLTVVEPRMTSSYRLLFGSSES